MNFARHLISLLWSVALVGGAAAQRSAPPVPATVENPSTAPAPLVAPAPVTAPEVSEQLFEPPPAANPATNNAGKGAPATTPGGKTNAPPPLSPRFRQVRDRIDALFGHRNEAPTRFDPRTDPFRGVGVIAAAPGTGRGGTPVGPSDAPPPTTTTNPDLLLLQQASALLKVTGNLEIDGRQHLILNKAPYKEGDVVIVRVKNRPVVLRLKEITRLTFTLTLNESELVVKY